MAKLPVRITGHRETKENQILFTNGNQIWTNCDIVWVWLETINFVIVVVSSGCDCVCMRLCGVWIWWISWEINSRCRLCVVYFPFIDSIRWYNTSRLRVQFFHHIFFSPVLARLIFFSPYKLLLTQSIAREDKRGRIYSTQKKTSRKIT